MSSSSDGANNSFFTTFGKVVEQFFASGSQAGEPVMISWLPREGEDGSGLGLIQYMDAGEIKQTQETVDILRRSLGTTSRGSGLDALRIHYRDFRTAVKSGNEAMMSDNPFYELTLRVFQLNLLALVGLFCQQLSGLAGKVPAPVWPAMPLREIWFHPTGKLGVLGRIQATLATFFLSGRLLLDGVLFLLSAVTTALAVNQWLSGSGVLNLVFAGLLDGEQLLLLRYLLCGLSGLLLSMVILDFKARLLRGIGESGFFFQGILDAFARKPRWMVLAAFLTLISFKTNYDAIVSLISIKADLGQQSKAVQDHVNLALGVWNQGNATKTASLHDYHAALNAAIGSIQKNFVTLAEDEIQSKTPGRGEPPKKGPRYFAKLFILEGGYDSGVRDVVKTFKDNAFARTIDKILRDSKLDLSLPLSKQLNTIKEEYEIHLAQTDNEVKAKLGQLTGMMRLDGGLVEEVQQIFTLDATQVNLLLQQIVALMELNAKQFHASANKLQELTNRYLTLVGQLDNAMSNASGAARQVQSKLADIPVLTPLENLKKVNISFVKGKSFTELKFFLIETQGAAAAFALLVALFVFCVLMDLAGLFLYGGRIAGRSALERRGFAKRMKLLKEWEDDFVDATLGFFARADVRWVLSGLSFPEQKLVRNAFYRYVEKLDPALKDVEDCLAGDRFARWFQTLFALPLSTEIAGYNARVHVMRGFMAQLRRYVAGFAEILYPGMHLGQGMGGLEFQEYCVAIREGYQQEQEAFARELQQIAAGVKQSAIADTILQTPQEPSGGERSSLQKFWEKCFGSGLPKKGGKSKISGRKKRGANSGLLQRIWGLLVEKSFKEPVPPFAHTRRNWLKELSVAVEPPPSLSHESVENEVAFSDDYRQASEPDFQVKDGQDAGSSGESGYQEVDSLESMDSSLPVLLVSSPASLVSSPASSALFASTASPVPLLASLPPLVPTFATNALFQLLDGGQELQVLVTDVDEESAHLRLEQLPLGVEIGSEGNLTLITEHGGRYSFLCRVVRMSLGELMIRLVSPDPLFVTLYQTLPPVVPVRGGDDLVMDADGEDGEPYGEDERELPPTFATLLTEDMVIDAASELIRTGCQEVRGLLWKIQIRGMELRKIRPSPVQLLRILGSHGLFLEQTPHVVEEILARLEVAFAPETPILAADKMSYLSSLAGESGDLLDRVRALVDALDDPIEREKRQVAAKQVEEKKMHGKESGANRSTTPSQQSSQHRISLQQVSGGFFVGIAGDLTRNGLRMVADEVFTSVKPGSRGLLKIIGKQKIAGFSVEVVRLAENEAILRILEDQERFESLAHAGEFGNLVCEQWDV